MASWQTRALCLYLQVTRKGKSGERALAGPRPPSPPPPRLASRTSRFEVAGFEMVRVVPLSDDPRPGAGAVLYLHGGAFIHGIAPQHWDLVAEIADRSGKNVYVACYGRAPTYDVDDARTFLKEVVAELQEVGPLQVVGDSAGGTLAMLVAQLQVGTGAISGLTLIAPLLDLTLDNPEVPAVERVDPWLSRAGVAPALRSWAGEHALDDPRVSPLFGRMDGLPPTLLLVGSRDICAPDCRRLRRDAPESWDLTVHVEEGSPHVYPLLPTPEGRRARERLLRHLCATRTDSAGS